MNDLPVNFRSFPSIRTDTSKINAAKSTQEIKGDNDIKFLVIMKPTKLALLEGFLKTCRITMPKECLRFGHTESRYY